MKFLYVLVLCVAIVGIYGAPYPSDESSSPNDSSEGETSSPSESSEDTEELSNPSSTILEILDEATTSSDLLYNPSSPTTEQSSAGPAN